MYRTSKTPPQNAFVFDRFTNSQNIVKEVIGELEGMLIETFKTEIQRETRIKKNRISKHSETTIKDVMYMQ